MRSWRGLRTFADEEETPLTIFAIRFIVVADHAVIQHVFFDLVRC